MPLIMDHIFDIWHVPYEYKYLLFYTNSNKLVINPMARQYGYAFIVYIRKVIEKQVW